MSKYSLQAAEESGLDSAAIKNSGGKLLLGTVGALCCTPLLTTGAPILGVIGVVTAAFLGIYKFLIAKFKK